MKWWEIVILVYLIIGVLFAVTVRVLENEVNKLLQKLHRNPRDSWKWWEHIGAALVWAVAWPLGLVMGLYPMTKELRELKGQLRALESFEKSRGR